MGILTRIRGEEGKAAARSLWTAWTNFFRNAAFGKGLDGLTGLDRVDRIYSPLAALMSPAVIACVTLMGGRMGALPRVVERRVGDTWEPVDDDESERLTDRWGTHLTADVALLKLMHSVMLWGSGYVLVVREGRGIAELRVLDPETVSREPVNGIVEYRIGDGGELVDRADLAVFDFLPPLDSTDPVPPLFHCWPAVRAGIAAERWAGWHFDRGANPVTFYEPDLEVAQQLPQGAMDVMWEDEDRMRREGRSSLLLAPGMRSRSTGSNMRDARVGEIVLTAKQSVCDVFRIPSVLLNDPTASTYHNVGEAKVDFARGPLTEWAQRVGAELSLACWPQGGMRLRFDLEHATAEPRTERAATTVSLYQAKIIGLGEARQDLDYPEEPPDDLLQTPLLDGVVDINGPDLGDANGNIPPPPNPDEEPEVVIEG